MSKKRTMSAAGQKRYNWVKEWKVGDLLFRHHNRNGGNPKPYLIDGIDLAPEIRTSEVSQNWRSKYHSYTEYPNNRCKRYAHIGIVPVGEGERELMMVNFSSIEDTSVFVEPRRGGTRATAYFGERHGPQFMEDGQTTIPFPYFTTSQKDFVEEEIWTAFERYKVTSDAALQGQQLDQANIDVALEAMGFWDGIVSKGPRALCADLVDAWDAIKHPSGDHPWIVEAKYEMDEESVELTINFPTQEYQGVYKRLTFSVTSECDGTLEEV